MTRIEKSRRELLLGGAALAASAGATGLGATAALAQQGPPQRFTTNELVDNGHRFFGSMSRGLAQVVEEATKRWGQPNAYILGQEASGAFIAGARYGEGQMYTRNAGQFIICPRPMRFSVALVAWMVPLILWRVLASPRSQQMKWWLCPFARALVHDWASISAI